MQQYALRHIKTISLVSISKFLRVIMVCVSPISAHSHLSYDRTDCAPFPGQVWSRWRWGERSWWSARCGQLCRWHSDLDQSPPPPCPRSYRKRTDLPSQSKPAKFHQFPTPCLVSDLWCLLSEVKVQPPTDELLIVFDIPQHEVVPQPAHSCCVPQTLLVEVYQDVDDEVVVGTFCHQTGDQVLRHPQLWLRYIRYHAIQEGIDIQ